MGCVHHPYLIFKMLHETIWLSFTGMDKGRAMNKETQKGLTS